MHVVMLSSDYLPNIGGIAAHVFHLANAMNHMGIKVTVVNPIDAPNDGIDVSCSTGFPVCTAKCAFIQSRIHRVINRARLIHRCLDQVSAKRGKIDIIHQHDYITSAFAANFYRGENKWIWTNHSSTFLYDYSNWLKRLKPRTVYGNVDGFITVSEELFQKTKSIFPKKKDVIAYIPNGVDVDYFHRAVSGEQMRRRNNISQDDFVVLCPRRMVEKNGVIYLAQAVRRLILKYPRIPWKFVFLGSEVSYNTTGDYIGNILSILEATDVKPYVVLLGNVPMGDMPEVNAMADVVVIPSLMEAVSLSALEAMATCRPVIASNVGGLPEIIKDGETGVLVAPKSDEHLADALVRLFYNRQN